MTQVFVVDGDVTQIEVDAIIAPINSVGIWLRGPNASIRRVAGEMFHDQAMAQMPLRDESVIVAFSTGLHGGLFEQVIFVVDDDELTADYPVLSALDAASNLGCSSVCLPLFHADFTVGANETKQEAMKNLAVAVKKFIRTDPTIEVIYVVVNNIVDYDLLTNLLADHSLVTS